MYLMNTLAAMSTTIRPFRFLSLFHYSGGASPLGQGLDAVGVAVLLGTSAALLVATAVLFERRDVHV
jgi:ABC-type transport system involved in multi-copper enzyme maturation permease subunit